MNIIHSYTLKKQFMGINIKGNISAKTKAKLQVLEAVANAKGNINIDGNIDESTLSSILTLNILKNNIKNGVNGKDGINGKDGNHGLDGIKGKDGINGINGKDGNHGLDGINGINGKDGKDGKNIRGDDGLTPEIIVKNDKILIKSGDTIKTIYLDELRGPRGIMGIAGLGLPTGGTAGQIVTKIDGLDYNTQWVDGGAGIDNFSYEDILSTDTITIPLGQQMAVFDTLNIDGTLIMDGTLILNN